MEVFFDYFFNIPDIYISNQNRFRETLGQVDAWCVGEGG
jgi:hypothetical protein